jgi:hypothetical protein
MKPLGRYTIFGLLIEVAAILSFIGIARTALAFPGKQIIIVVFLIAIIALLFMAMRLLSFRNLMLLAAFLTIGFIATYQMLGFAFFPGLVKDIAPLSLEHLRTTGTIAILVFFGYIACIVAILAIKKIMKLENK